MEEITIQPQNKEQVDALEIILKAMKIPFKKSKEVKSSYNPEFVAKIKRSEKNFSERKFTTIKVEDLWK